MDKLRVIQWTTGKVGKLTLRGVLDDPRLELAGVYAWSADKKGQDAGPLCGRPECGIAATNDIDELIDTGERTAWPKVEMVRTQTAISRALEGILARIDKAGDDGPGHRSTAALKKAVR